MSRSPDPTRTGSDPSLYRRQRAMQIIACALAAVGVGALTALASGKLATLGVLALTGLALGVAVVAACTGRLRLAVGLLHGAVLAMVAALAWRGAGLQDPVLLALPGLLVFNVMLGRDRLFAALLLTMLALTGVLFAAHALGWRRFVPAPDPSTLIYLWAILIGSGFAIWLLAQDLHRALTAAQEESQSAHRSRADLERAGHHDALTGLPNRVIARLRFGQAMSGAQRTGGRCALLYLDLDQFRTVNESMGHAAGDQLLCQVGERLQQLARGQDTVCRLGGDEFLLLLPDVGSAEAARLAAQAAVESLSRPFQVGGLDLVSGPSVGVALSPDDGRDFDELLKNADIAMYRAKSAGGGCCRFFDPQMHDSVQTHRRLQGGLQQALERSELTLHWQPQVDLHSGRVVGAEALLRWTHPELGSVPPAAFIPVAERSGLITPIGAWVLQQACREAAAWRDPALSELLVSVNLSSVQLRRGNVEQDVLRALELSGLPAHRLELELTESMIVDDSVHVVDTLRRLVGMGVSLAIDDFGTGYSNLAYLKRFQVGRLKIDQGFVRRLTQDRHDRAIVGAITQMARSLGLVSIAEGVEDDATLALLREIGCDLGQGYRWARPMPAQAFAGWLAQHRDAVGASVRPLRLPVPALRVAPAPV